MPRFYFHSTGPAPHHDDEGVDLPDGREAETEALRVLGELMRDAPGWPWDGEPLALHVIDEGGRQILTLEVLASRGLKPPST